jgi:hypothetical protein
MSLADPLRIFDPNRRTRRWTPAKPTDESGRRQPCFWAELLELLLWLLL